MPSIRPAEIANLCRRDPHEPQTKLEVDDTPDESTQHAEPSISPEGSNNRKGEPQHDADMRANKIQAIFARYNVELNETEWDRRPKIPHERVHKNIRMRVRYTCHNCSTTFGGDRVCVGCQHRRCSRCSRYPAKRDRPKATESAPPEPTTDAPRPRVEGGTCHECQTGFEPDAQQCPNCHHQMCEKCAQEATVTVEPSQGGPSQSTHAAASASEEGSEQRTTTQQESTPVS